MNGLEHFGVEEWLIFLTLVAVVLFFLYPKTNGDFDEDYISKENGKERYWWQEEKEEGHPWNR